MDDDGVQLAIHPDGHKGRLRFCVRKLRSLIDSSLSGKAREIEGEGLFYEH